MGDVPRGPHHLIFAGFEFSTKAGYLTISRSCREPCVQQISLNSPDLKLPVDAVADYIRDCYTVLQHTSGAREVSVDPKSTRCD
jgi:hypothetical protein